jgi:hypothetical protein
MKRLNWKDGDDGRSMVAWASRAVGGKYHIVRCEDADGVRFETEHRVDLCASGSERYRGLWEITPVRHQPVARTWREAMDAAEADNDRRRAIKERGAAQREIREE